MLFAAPTLVNAGKGKNKDNKREEIEQTREYQPSVAVTYTMICPHCSTERIIPCPTVQGLTTHKCEACERKYILDTRFVGLGNPRIVAVP